MIVGDFAQVRGNVRVTYISGSLPAQVILRYLIHDLLSNKTEEKKNLLRLSESIKSVENGYGFFIPSDRFRIEISVFTVDGQLVSNVFNESHSNEVTPPPPPPPPFTNVEVLVTYGNGQTSTLLMRNSDFTQLKNKHGNCVSFSVIREVTGRITPPPLSQNDSVIQGGINLNGCVGGIETGLGNVDKIVMGALIAGAILPLGRKKK